MNWDTDPYSVALFASAGIALIIAILTWRRRSAPGALPLFLMLVTTVIWAGANGFLLQAKTPQIRLLWFNILSVGALCGSPAFLAFALQYTGRERWLTPRNVILICLIPFAGVLLTWTNDLHHLFYTEIDFTSSLPAGGKATPGIGYNIYLVYSYPLVLYSIAIVAQTFIRSPRIHRGQAGTILIGTLIPLLGNIAYNIVADGAAKGWADPTPILFTIMGVFYAFGLFAFRLFDILPVARHTLIERMTDGMLVVDSQNRIMDINPAAIQLLGLAPHSTIGLALDQIAFPFPDGLTQQTKITLVGEPPHYFDVRAESLLDGQNQANGRLIVVRDVTETKQAQTSLEKARREIEEREHRFRRVFQVSPVAIVVTTLKEGRTIEANDAYWKLSGHDPKTAIGKTTLELRADYDAHKRQEFVDSLIEKKSIRNPDYIFMDDDGNHHDTMAFFELIDLEGQPMILSMFYDMTEQVEALEALERSEERVRGLLNAIPETIFELRHDGLILEYVPSDEASAHDAFGDVVGQSIHQIMPASIAGQIMFAVERALDSGQIHIIEYQLSQGDKEITYEARVTVSGPDSVLLMARDVSLHKSFEIERERLINELDSKNSELERFTYAVSHDLRSPLITLKGFLGFLKADIDSGNRVRIQTDLQRMGSAMDIMQQRLDDLLELSRAGRLTEKSEVIRFNDLVAKALELVHGRISQRGIMIHVDENFPSLMGNRHRLLEVIQNLIDNAAKFMGDQPDPRIEIGQRGEEDGKPVFFVKDNGVGIPPEQHERIFGIFNKLDPNAEGTGIGLSLVKKIIEVHGGRIWVESEVGQGTAFYFTLPHGKI